MEPIGGCLLLHEVGVLHELVRVELRGGRASLADDVCPDACAEEHQRDADGLESHGTGALVQRSRWFDAAPPVH